MTKDNTIEAFFAADYFQLSGLQEFIMKTINSTNFAKNYSPELLFEVSETVPLTEDNIILNLLVETVATILRFEEILLSLFSFLGPVQKVSGS